MGVLVWSWNGTAQGVFFEKFLIFGGGSILFLIVFLLRGLVSGRLTVGRIPIGWLLGILVLVFGASTLFSDDSRRSVWGLFTDPFLGFLGICLLCLFAFVMASAYCDRIFRVITFAFVGSSAIIAFATLGAFPAWFIGYSPATLFAVLLTGIFFAVTILSEGDAKGFFRGVAQKVWILFLFLVLGVSLFSAQRFLEDVFWWAVVLGFGVFLLFALARKVTFSQRSVLAISVVVIFFGLRFFTGGVPGTLPDIAPGAGVSWEVAKESFFDRPMFGYGPAMYGRAYALHVPSDVSQTPLLGRYFPVAVGGIGEWISTVGSVGALVFLLLIAGYIGVVWYALKESVHSNNRDLLCFFSASMGLLPILLCIEYNGVVLFLFFLLLGGIFGVLSRRAIRRDPQLWEIAFCWNPRYLPAFVIAGIFFLGLGSLFAVSVSEMMRAGIYAHRAENEKELLRARDFLERSRALDPKESEYARRLGETNTALATQASLSPDRDALKMEQFYNSAFVSASEAIRLAPTHLPAVESSARIYEIAGSTIPQALDLSAEQYAQLETLSPNNPIYPFKRGSLLLQAVQGDTKMDEETKKKKLRESDTALARAIFLAGNFPSAHYQLALLHREKKEHDEAVWNALRAVELSSNDTTSILLLVSLYLDDVKKVSEIEMLLERVKALSPDDPAVYLYYGRLHALREKKEEARASYEKAKSLLTPDQKNVEIYIDGLIKDLDAPPEE